MVAYNPSHVQEASSLQAFTTIKPTYRLSTTSQHPHGCRQFTPTISRFSTSLASMAREDPDISRLTDKFLALRKRQGQKTQSQTRRRWTLCQKRHYGHGSQDPIGQAPMGQVHGSTHLQHGACRGHCEASASLVTITGDKTRTWITTLFNTRNVHSRVRNSLRTKHNHMVAFEMCTAASALRAAPEGCP
jgi:hypothetical protein